MLRTPHIKSAWSYNILAFDGIKAANRFAARKRIFRTAGRTDMSTRSFALAAALLLGGTLDAPAQDSYPSRPITIVVPFPAGGPTDALGRILAEPIRVALGQSVMIENVAGAAGSIGVGRVARAKPDGYTLSLSISSTFVANGAVYNLPYDVVKDFEPIAQVAREPLVIVAKKAMPANDLKGLIAWLKANPDRALQGAAGVGTPGHIAGVFLQRLTDTRFQFVQYRGGAPLMQDLVAGRIDFDIDSQASAVPQAQAGRIRAYAVTAKSRLATAPEIPTVDEAGFPGFHFSVWLALFAPKGVPKDVIAKLNAAVVNALADPAVRERIGAQGMEIPLREELTPEALGALQKADIEKWWPIIKAAGIRAE
jgi:tripartite-type tricarboxylate transporter receptor subunit TctC